MSVNEQGFEDVIEASMLAAGAYLKSEPAHFDAALGLNIVELFAFLEATQPKEWGELTARYGGAHKARAGFVKRLAKELDDRGTVDVLRHGVVDLGITLRLAFFKPAHGLTPDLVKLYEANRVTVTRQLAYETASGKAIDLGLLVNGIPTATAELKNQLTGQHVEHAKKQYREDRDPANVTLARRAIVHFAVDPENVAMTTRLDGPSTQFIPFNQGSGGAGEAGGAGNPPNSNGHRTAYLWEHIWQRDSWLDILARFVHVVVPETGSAAEKRKGTRTVFPRFQQLDAVRKLEADARREGPGHNYLVQHSAGSGKSNTIAWLAHRLSNLHDATDGKVFDKVVVITDRLVLDRQLQDTIYQFEHARGVVVKVDKDSQQLADALSGQQARIIITTLQKFPFVIEKVGSLSNRTYAVIVDEAHSSQTGDAAREMRSVLATAPKAAGGPNSRTALMAAEEGTAYDAGQPPDPALGAAEAAESREESEHGDGQDELERTLRGRGRQKNISFFAFTATPKAKTLELFGRKRGTGADEKYWPTHLYSMKQAIEEGFILDVLANYTTYERYYRLEKAIREDPNYDEARARRAIARYIELHPYNLAQKAEIVVEHFRQHVRHRIGGRAKAMVVTSSRLHAVRYKLAIDKVHRRQGLHRRGGARGVLGQGDRCRRRVHGARDEPLPGVGDGGPIRDGRVPGARSG
jgi:type I restriction enzyme, R subunit